MALNPVDAVYVDGAPTSKSSVRGYEKQYVRKRMANVDEVRNTDLAGQFSGVDVSSLGALFDIDTSDTTSPDDGVNTLVSNDGYRFKRRQDQGGYVPRTETGNGAIALSVSDSVVLLAPTVPAPRAVALPSTGSTPIEVKDANGSWSDTNVSTFTVAGGTINGQSSWLGMTPYGSFKFTPKGDGNYLAE